MTVAYEPPRDLASKLGRRLTQWRAARPATLRFAQPMLSVCFDDFPASAALNGARILEARGARGTFFAAAGLAEQDGPCGRNFSAADLLRLAKVGHEIACHTYAHKDCARSETYEVLKDIAANRDALALMGASAPNTLAYPYGETTTALKNALPPRFSCARGVLPGLNIGRTDLAQLRAYPLFGVNAMDRAQASLKRAARMNAWMIAFTHDVETTPSLYGTSCNDLEAFLSAAQTMGFEIAPMNEVLGQRLP